MKKVIVVGGGFTGLITAYYLSRAGFSVELHEARSRLGGLLSSVRTPQGLIESAANGMILNEDVEELFQELDISALKPIEQYKKRRFIFRNGMRRWPLSFLESLQLLGKLLPKLLFAKSQLKPQDTETIWQWGLKNLGPAATRYFLSPALQGIYAGDPRRMSASAILGGFFSGQKRKRYGGTLTPSEGMGQLIQKLKEKVEEQGVRIHLNSTYELRSLEIPQVVCVSAAASPQVLKYVAPELAEKLSQIETLSLLSVTVFFEEPQFKIEGFGCLMPEDQGVESLGVLSSTYIFENRGPNYSETWILGGARSPELYRKSDSEIIQGIQKDRKRILGEEGKILNFHIHRWPSALPHFTVEHNNLMRGLELPVNLYLNGNYIDVLGLSKILTRTKLLVNKIKEAPSCPEKA